MSTPKSIVAKRDTTFSYLFLLPDKIPVRFFQSWLPTAQLRKSGSDSASGLIADLSVFWSDPATNKILGVFHNETEKWPLGPAEMDILLTSASGQTVRSKVVPFLIERGITK